MLLVTNQLQNETYNIEYFHLNVKEDGTYEMVGMARLNLKETKIVWLANYKYYRQAINVFSSMDMLDNDLIFYKRDGRWYTMPENILTEEELNVIYPVRPF